MRTCRFPAREPITVRSARAVRPPRPMTLPRSSGCTRTSRTLPRRSILLITRTSSGCVTIPRIRCSRDSSSTSGLAATVTSRSSLGNRAVGGRGLGGLGRGSLGSRHDLGRRGLGGGRLSSGCLGRRLGGGRRGLGLLGVTLRSGRPGGLGSRLGLLSREGLLHELLVALLLVGLRLARPPPALGTGQALELLPVTGDGQQALDRLGRLRADRQPVLRAVGVDLNERRLQLRVVLADLLDRATVPLGAGVGDDDPVERFPDLAQAL